MCIRDRTFTILENPVIQGQNAGAGCTFASSIASHLIKGDKLLPAVESSKAFVYRAIAVSYTHLRAHETVLDLVCRLLLEKKNHVISSLKSSLHLSTIIFPSLFLSLL
ncbi:bifunctional hydroxymethylpyrimidine kinase/phosphomethylpyrimidine kinase [Streptococcus pneumoniae D39]|nr:bifunctional hydroxymethylpyrimidine kinase/phosphomethylpyrimidine kinase [Streptococcus pneumoniae D39]